MINDISVLVTEKNKIIEACVSYMKEHYPNRTTEYDKCHRDLLYIIDAFIRDLSDGTTNNSIYIGNKFWIRDTRQVGTYQVELAVYEYMIKYINETFDVSTNFVSQITALKDIIANIVENGAIEEPNSWQKSASLRINTYKWKDTAPNIDMIQSIMEDLHKYSPSKQNGVRYHVDVYRNDNEENRNKIYRAHAAGSDDNARHNPQVLAPWLLFFSLRSAAEKKPEYSKVDFYMDLGIAVSNVIYSASSKGLDTGLSRCINYPQELQDVLGYVPNMTIGIGHRDIGIEYFCPYYKKMVYIPGGDFIKPEFNEYIRYV
jgi:hypothetical protein